MQILKHYKLKQKKMPKEKKMSSKCSRWIILITWRETDTTFWKYHSFLKGYITSNICVNLALNGLV